MRGSIRRSALRMLASAALVCGIAAFFYHLAPANSTTISLTLLLAILAIATGWGLLEAVFASVLALILFNYLFLPPVRTFTIADPQNWVALLAFLITAITASQLSVRAKRRAAEAEERRREVERLYALGQAMLLSGGLHSMAKDIIRHIIRIFEIPAVVLYTRGENEVFRSSPETLSVTDELLATVSNRMEPMIQQETQVAVVPVRLGGQPIGSLGLVGRVPSAAALNAVAYLTAVGIERARSLEEANRIEAARQSETLKSALLDALAHDLKTPLTSIKGALTHLLGKKHDCEEQELLSLANEEADRLNRLTVEVLEMARIEAGKLHPDRRPQEIAGVIAAALKEMEGSLKDRHVEVEIPADLPPADLDSDFIQQVFRQLLDNAVRYSPPGSPITISARLAGGKIVVSVSDRGVGIREEEQHRIFEKFYRGHEMRYQVPGTGLGLSIAKGIVEAHGGKISVSSAPGAGSVFSVSLPLSRKEDLYEHG